ncbi:SAM-dependent methyltransferase [Virgibacillus profundi]|uniref:Uncharacterized methyltransferase CIL05_10705 n=1 Tax=Virgibacillus profundi TaxID=2024555 RepID=A0A2A2IEZ5_9BACI|nr:class I SAM-dependent methyltransferase [Virgibacillus profundi]PAV29824.1 SAM-dependent methyltransferase [Virgibacillus profundi]PXY53995.1 class I SAM-dependent methyltransferase [Virgibacillus profundi]
MGREFLDLFEEWAGTYDDTVTGIDPQYRAVFANYNKILDEVVKNSEGTVLEFGVGTGNLTEKIMDAGHEVIGIEPSQAMLDIASEKYPELTLLEGDFITFPEVDAVETIVSTYAFHHLTDSEKEIAVAQFADILPPNGKIVFGDTMFQSEDIKQKMINEASEKEYTDLAEDLQREYYTTLEVMQNIFKNNNFNVTFKQMNEFVWLVVAEKTSEER